MSSTSFTPHTHQPHQLTLAASQLLRSLQEQPAKTPSNDEKVHIPDIADNAYWAYEKLRNAVEYQEQHLLMRSAIGRFLQRHFDNSQTKHETLGYEIIRELTKARYLANGSVSQSIVAVLNERAVAYRQLYQAALPHYGKDKQRLFQFVIGVASADMQRILLPNPAQDALINFTYHSFQGHIENGELRGADEAISLYIAVHRALLKSDVPTIQHYMFMNQFPAWFESKNTITQTADNLKQLEETVAKVLRDRKSHVIGRMVRSHIAPYVILHHTLQDSKYPEQLLLSPEKLTSRASEVADIQYKKAKKRLRASIFRAIIFLFITKMAVALIAEVPYEYYVMRELHYLPLTINLLFPPLYMLIIGLTIKTPDFRNTTAIVGDLRAALFQQYKLRYSLKSAQNKELGATFNILYGLCTIIVIAGISYVLSLLQFSAVSGIIFFVFLSTVSFFGYRISQSVRELVVVEKRNGLDMLWSIVFTPFIRFGQWMSDRYSQFNVFMLVLDFIIEAPFKTLLRVYEQWSTFLREKQDDVLK